MEPDRPNENKFLQWIKSLHNMTERFDLFHDDHTDTIEHWLRTHYFFGLAIVITVAVVEFIFVFLFQNIRFYSMPRWEYRLSYFAIPTGANLAMAIIIYIIYKKSKDDFVKATAISFMYAFVAFVTYTVHIRFPSLELLFCLPMFFSVVYGNVKLTSLAAFFSIGLKVFSDVFFNWEEVSKLYVGVNDALDLFFSLWALILMLNVCIVIIRVEQKKHAVSMKRQKDKAALYQETMTDALTGVFNRNGLRKEFDKMMGDESDSVFTLVMIDMDRFKAINDTYGHSIGDEYLKALGDAISNTENSTAFRFGGDEFCMLFKDVSVKDVETSLIEVQRNFSTAKVCREVKEMTVSFGAAVYDKDLTPSDLINRADEALYIAKKNRGTIKFYEEKE